MYAAAPNFDVVSAVSWEVLSILWVVADARGRRVVPCFEFGFLCLVFFPISLAWYCFWSRGWRGLLTLGLLASLRVIPYFLGIVASVFRHGVV
jgi:hypothetical protein